MKTKKIVVFDLDDTLYKEIDFLKSAYWEIANRVSKELGTDSYPIYREMLANYYNKCNPFEKLIDKYAISYSLPDLLSFYRNHIPQLELSVENRRVLDILKKRNIVINILTDGRGIQQRNKLKALGITNYFSEIVISEELGTEKPHIDNFKYFENVYGIGEYYYIGDNITKDFVTPNKLNWETICLIDDGRNIHSQDRKVPRHYLAKHTVSSLNEVLSIIE